MSGIFDGHAFGGLGQATSDPAFDSLISGLRTTGGATTTTPYTPPSYVTQANPYAKGGSAPVINGTAPQTVAQQAATYIPPPASDNTTLYVVGGVAAVGILAAIFMMSGRRRVAANRRRKRSH
jgi:hypothetical protein